MNVPQTASHQKEAVLNFDLYRYITKLFRYLKWRYSNLYKLYGYGICKGKPTQCRQLWPKVLRGVQKGRLVWPGKQASSQAFGTSELSAFLDKAQSSTCAFGTIACPQLQKLDKAEASDFAAA